MMKDEELKWKELSCEHVVHDEWMDFRKQVFQFPDGTSFGPYYTYSRRDYAVIVAYDTEGNLICVRQFRPGIREVTTEFTAGGLERTDGKEYGNRDGKASEDALACAKRELMEETGYVSEEWRHLLTVPSQATIADNYAFLFEARNCHRAGSQHLDATEFLNVEILTPGEIEEKIRDGKFQQAVHILAWMLSQKR